MYGTGKYLLFKEAMNLRCLPNKNSKLITQIPQGYCVEVENVSDNWGKVTFEDKTGWCCISPCFAKKICSCDSSGCEYYRKYIALKDKNRKLKEVLDSILDDNNC